MPDQQTATTEQAAAPPASPTVEQFEALKAELETIKTSAAENQRTAEYWHQKATAAPAKETKVETEDETDLLDLIANKGEKGLDALLEKRGFVRKSAVDDLLTKVDAKINGKYQQATEEARLLKQYPDLADSESAFFKETAKEYGRLQKLGIEERLIAPLAAQAVELKMIRDGSMKTPAQIAADKAKQKEEERLARIKAQSGDRGSRPVEGDGDEDDELTAEQKRSAHMLVGMEGRDGKRITQEEAERLYKERAKKGVAMKGTGR